MKLFLGIDVSKGYADFLLLNEQHQKLEDIFQLDDNQQGHDLLKEQMNRWVEMYKPSVIYSGVESTGGFESNWYHALFQYREILPVQVIRLNPRGVKHSSKAELKRNVTDALSAQYIAEYLIRYQSTLRFNELSNQDRDGYSALYKHIELLKKQQTQRINQFRQLIYNVFPEILMYCRNPCTWRKYALHLAL
ncbi:MAG: IS110 family transposase [Bacteroidota bacterium]|nr:IS110 family transposase [Bacteroidota bacterium]